MVLELNYISIRPKRKVQIKLDLRIVLIILSIKSESKMNY